MNKGIIIGIVIALIIVGVAGAVSMSVGNDSIQVPEIASEEKVAPEGRNLSIKLSESIGIKTP